MNIIIPHTFMAHTPLFYFIFFSSFCLSNVGGLLCGGWLGKNRQQKNGLAGEGAGRGIKEKRPMNTHREEREMLT